MSNYVKFSTKKRGLLTEKRYKSRLFGGFSLVNGVYSRSTGLLNPITVRVDGKGYRLIAGYHRLEACKAIGWLEIDACVVDLTDNQAALF